MAFVKRTTQTENVIVNLDARETRAKVLRKGVEVQAPATRPESIVGLLDALGQFTTFEEPRVLRQVPAPGTLVAPGTVISMTLVPPSDTPFRVFDGIHAGLLQSNVDRLVNVLTQNVQVAGILSQYPTADAVPAADRQIMAAAAGVEIDDNVEGQRFGELFNSFGVASVYK